MQIDHAVGTFCGKIHKKLGLNGSTDSLRVNAKLPTGGGNVKRKRRGQ